MKFNKGTLTSNFKTIRLAASYSSTYYKTSASNCKLAFAEHLSILGDNGYPKKERVALLNEILKGTYAVLLFVTLSNKIAKDFVLENFDIEYCVKVPIGYNKGYQYHICIRNPFDKRTKEYKARKEESILINKKTKETDLSEKVAKILHTIEKKEYKTTRGMFNGFKRLLSKI